jgi:exopolysaccharide production protein ExoY
MIPIKHDPIKRTFDIIFSMLVLAGSAPLLIAIALTVSLTSFGSPIYRSSRLGRGGKVIRCLKFRTMYRDADERLAELLNNSDTLNQEWKRFQKLKDDPRITPVGKYLRRLSLDELLQFWNVVKGDMSIVGPRPLTMSGPEESYLEQMFSLYGEDSRTILSVRPGITGIWQVSGRSEIPLTIRQKLEKHYALQRTFKTDLALIAKTIPAVLFSKGAV